MGRQIETKENEVKKGKKKKKLRIGRIIFLIIIIPAIKHHINKIILFIPSIPNCSLKNKAKGLLTTLPGFTIIIINGKTRTILKNSRRLVIKAIKSIYNNFISYPRPKYFKNFPNVFKNISYFLIK